jgi:prephenate dehydrogenase
MAILTGGGVSQASVPFRQERCILKLFPNQIRPERINMKNQTATIVGVNGGFGSLFAARLAAAGWTLHGVDRAPTAGNPEHLASYHHLAQDMPEGIPEAIFADSRVWLLCTPDWATFRWAEYLVPGMEEGCLCLDILSVKEPITEYVGKMNFAGEYLSLHPMFASGLGFEDRAVAVVPVREGPVSAEFAAMLEQWGARLVRLDAENHDRTTAVLQVGVHAALLALARAADEAVVDRELLRQLATPVSGPIFAAIDMILRGKPETYQAIQDQNRYGDVMRRGMVHAIRELEHDQNIAWLFKQLQ